MRKTREEAAKTKEEAAKTKAGEAARNATVAVNKTRAVPVVTLGPAMVGAPVTMRAHAGNLGGGLETQEAWRGMGEARWRGLVLPRFRGAAGHQAHSASAKELQPTQLAARTLRSKTHV